MKQRTIYVTLRIDYTEHKEVQYSETSAAFIAQSAVNAHDTTIYDGVQINETSICHIENEDGKEFHF